VYIYIKKISKKNIYRSITKESVIGGYTPIFKHTQVRSSLMKSNFLVQFPLVHLKIPTILYHTVSMISWSPLNPMKSSSGWWFQPYPSEKWWSESHLGWFFHSQLNGKSFKIPGFQSPHVTTNQKYIHAYGNLWTVKIDDLPIENGWIFQFAFCKRLPFTGENPINSPEMAGEISHPPGHRLDISSFLLSAGRTNQWMIGINTNQWDLMGI